MNENEKSFCVEERKREGFEFFVGGILSDATTSGEKKVKCECLCSGAARCGL
jgi:hypothetical protein